MQCDVGGARRPSSPRKPQRTGGYDRRDHGRIAGDGQPPRIDGGATRRDDAARPKDGRCLEGAAGGLTLGMPTTRAREPDLLRLQKFFLPRATSTSALGA